MARPLPAFDLFKGSEAERYRSRLSEIRRGAEPILSNRLHTNYTDHSVTHSDRICDTIDCLARRSAQLPLDPPEAFSLYAAAYLHDIGMHFERVSRLESMAGELRRQGHRWESMGRDERLDFLRRRHGAISAQMIRASIREGNAPPVGTTLTHHDCTDLVAPLCEAHTLGTGDPRYITLIDDADRPNRRMRLLSALLRLADVLDEAAHRAPREQFHTLDLDPESKMHWWRHGYTRDVTFESDRRRVTVQFDFPLAQRDDYAAIVPPLQMPWIEQEFARHHAVLAEFGLPWHVTSEVMASEYGAAEVMPDDVRGRMLVELAKRQESDAGIARMKLFSHYDQVRSHLRARLRDVRAERDHTMPEAYLTAVLRWCEELASINYLMSASDELRSAIFHATKNGRTVSDALHVKAATALARMTFRSGHPRDAMMAAMDAEDAIKRLPDASSEKAEWHGVFASITLRSGYYTQGSDHAAVAMRLLSGPVRDSIAADWAEAMFLEGHAVRDPREAES